MLLVSLSMLSACTAQNAGSRWQSMTLNQTKPILVEAADEDGVREHGEGMFFEAKLTDEGGKPVAQLLGQHTIVDTPGDDGVGDPIVEERFTSMSIVFEDGDEIVIQGANTYPMNQRIMKSEAPQYRAIIGGTGKYKGIQGQIKTARNADETYTHTLEYRLD